MRKNYTLYKQTKWTCCGQEEEKEGSIGSLGLVNQSYYIWDK